MDFFFVPSEGAVSSVRSMTSRSCQSGKVQLFGRFPTGALTLEGRWVVEECSASDAWLTLVGAGEVE